MNQNIKGAEADIRGVIATWADSFRSRNVEAAMRLHAPDVVSFDMVPPLRYQGIDDYRSAWRAMFDAFEGPIEVEVRDLSVTVGDGVAFTFSMNRFCGTATDGQKVDYWWRWTACFERLDGKWLIVHDHQSLPTDFATGTSVQTLEP